jgi:hypothetical protein
MKPNAQSLAPTLLTKIIIFLKLAYLKNLGKRGPESKKYIKPSGNFCR